MNKITKDQKVVCCCAGGQFRSVATRNILSDRYGMVNVLACGLEKNGTGTLEMLFDWADHIIVSGEKQLADRVPERWRAKMIHLDIGLDVWGHCLNPNLLARLDALLRPMIG